MSARIDTTLDMTTTHKFPLLGDEPPAQALGHDGLPVPEADVFHLVAGPGSRYDQNSVSLLLSRIPLVIVKVKLYNIFQTYFLQHGYFLKNFFTAIIGIHDF